MGDEIKLLCSETSSHNNARELKDVFLRRFKLSDDFWKDLFFENCPEGLGEVNEKLRNGEDLSSCDFKPFEDLSFHQENHSCNTENDILNKPSASVVEFKTPLLIKSLSNASHSPSLFSPSVTQDYNVQKGPNSSTPLPWKSVHSPSTPGAGTTPTSTKNIFHNDFKTPVANILDQTFTNPKTTTSKLSRSLSATLEMDPASYLSWTSSLATPPEHEEKTSTNISDLQGTTSFDVSKIVAEERVPCEIEGKTKSSKGVARVLFTNECQGFERSPLAKEVSLKSNTALETSSMLNLPLSLNMSVKNVTFNTSTALESDTSKHLITGECDGGLCDSVDATCRLKPGNHVGNDTRDNISEVADKDYLGTVTENIELEKSSFSNECKGSQNGARHEANRNANYTVDYFDTSMLSPLHRSVEQAMVRMTAMVDTPKLFIPGENNIPNPNNNKKQDHIDFSNRPIVIDTALNLALEKCDKTGNINNVHDINICSESIVNMEASKECVDIKHEDCKNVFDMDALSEFPLDFEFSEGIAVSTTGTQPINSNLDQPTIVCKQEDQYSKNHLFLVNLSNQVDGADTKYCIEDLDIVRVTKQPSRTMTSSERISDNSSEHGEIVTKKDYLDRKNINTRQIPNMFKTDTLPKSYNGKKHDSELVSIGRNEESKTRKLRRNVETASQVLRDLSLQHLCDITYDAEDIPDLQLTAETKLNEQSEMMSSDNLTNVDIGNGRYTNDLKVDETCTDASVVGEQKIDSFSFDISNEGENVFKDIKNDKSVREQNGSSVLSGPLYASGRNITVSKESLKKAITVVTHVGKDDVDKCEESKRVNENDSIGFLTISGSEKEVTADCEKSLEKARISLNEVDKGEGNTCKSSIGKDENATLGFSTALEKKITFSEESLNRARKILNDVDEEENIFNSERAVKKNNLGVTMASGKKLTFPERSLVKDVVKDKEEYQDGQQPRVSVSVGFSTAFVNNKPAMGFSTASGKEVTVSEESLRKARRILNEVDKDEEYSCQDNRKVKVKTNIGFSTASGKEVTVSDESLKRARKILNEVDKDEEYSCQDNRRVKGKGNVGFSAASGKEVAVSNESLEKARKFLDDVVKDEEKFQEIRKFDMKTNVGFSTASGKKVSVSEESLQKARRILNDVDNNNNKEYSCQDSKRLDVKTKFGFSTASGKEVTVSEESLQKARRILNEVDKEEQNETVSSRNVKEKPGVGFSTAFKKVTFSEEALEKGRKILNDMVKDEEKYQGSSNMMGKSNFGFSTASGKHVTISEKSLEQARKILNEVDKDGQNKCENSTRMNEKPDVGLPTTSGKKMSISDESLENGPRSLNEKKCRDNKQLGVIDNVGFSTASGKEVIVSEESLQKARRILNEVDKDEQNEIVCSRRANEKPGNGFSTASGKEVIVSEESLQKARRILNEVDKDEQNETVSSRRVNEKPGNGFSTASGKEVIVSEESLQKARRILNEVDKDEQNEIVSSRRVNEKPGNGFSTASGKEVIVSEESLQKARRILNEVDKDEQNETVSSRRVNEKLGNGFSTASGKEVIVSEESLQKARRILNEVDKDEQNETVSSRRVNEKLGNGFSTASGKEVTVSDVSLEKAKKILNEVAKDEEYSCQDNRNVKGKANVGFSTASGKEVAISEESLKKATRILNEIDKDEQNKCEIERRVVVNESHVGFSTASGRHVAVSKESLKKARRILSEVDKDEENKYEGGKRTDEKPYVSTTFRDNVTVSDESLENPERIMNELDEDEKGKCKENRKVQVFEYALACEKQATTSGDLLQKESGFGPRRKSKRPSCESEDVRPCKALRTETNVSNAVNQAVLCSKQDESRSWMKPYSSDPLEFYSDRKYSKFKSPLKPVVVSPDSEFTKQLSSRKQFMDTSGKWFSPHHPKSEADINDDQRRCKEYSSSTVNAMTKRKSNSYFVTPYRTSECDGNSVKRQLSAQTYEPQSVSNNTSSKKSKLNDYCDPGSTRSGKTSEDKKFLVKPQAGSIYRLRNNSSFKRISFADYVGNGNKSWSSNELFKYGIPPSVLSINCEKAGSYRFNGSDFLSDNACETNTGVRFTDGAVLFLGQDKCFGLEEFTKAFLCSPGVDCNLISEQWISNHYRWIIWKLASYEVTYPQLFCGRSLTPDMVLRQLKYRYDREIDRCERSAIKKILERDDTASRGMVLCVSSMDIPNSEINHETKTNGQETSCEAKQKIVLMTDGWYCIRVQLDSYLQILAKQGKIFTGQKLYIQGAELVGSDQAVSPLEAPCNLFLRIYGNSCRPAKKFSRLGFHCKNSTFTVPIKSLSSNGGLVSSISVIVARQYPLQFMEKQSDGSCVFRNPRCEERLAKKFEEGIQRRREKTMYQVQVEIDKEEMQIKKCKRRKRDTLSTQRIESLHDGKEIFDAISNATDPSSVQDALSDEQKRILYNYKRNFQDNKVAIMQRKYDETWKKLCEEETLERNVVPVLKVKLVDNLSPKRNNTAGTALLTVWRPSEQIITTLGEGKRLKIYNVYASKYSKGANDIQLSANRSTIYKELTFDTKCQDVFQARKVYTFGELSKGLKPGVEVDIVAVVISHSSQSNLTLVYMADPDLNFVRLRIWGGLEDQALQDIMKEKGFIAASNLLCQPDRRSGIPSLKYYELSMATSNPSNQMLRHNLRELRKAVLDPASFVAQAKAKLNKLCGEASKWTTPNGSSGTASRITPSYSEDGKRANETPLQCNKEVMFGETKQGWSAPSNSITPNSSTSMTCCKTAGNLQQSRKRLLQLKRRKLDLIPNPPPLSPLPNTLPDSVRKEFKVPRRIITQSKENDTM